MPIPYASSIDLIGNELQNARIQNLATAPTHAVGRIYFDTGTGLLGVSNGSAWTYLAVGALDTEAVQDVVGAMGTGSTVVTATYNDAAGTIAFSIGNSQVTNAMVATGISADKLAAGSTNTVFLVTEKTKLTGIATGATANSTDATLLARANHTGTQSADTLTDGTTNKAFLATERTKLTGIATAATANDTDANLKARANHTGTQVAATISDFNAAVDARVANVVGAAPAALDTLVELSAALGNDANFAGTVTTQLATKATKYSADVGNGSLTSIVITHNLNTRDVIVQLRLTGTPYTGVEVEWEATSVNTLTLKFATAPTTAQYRVTVLG